MSFCHECGATVSDGAKFCEQCGTKLNPPADALQKPDEKSTTPSKETQPKQTDENNVEEIDLTEMDKKAAAGLDNDSKTPTANSQSPNKNKPEQPKKADNIINLNDILESEEKVEIDNSIKREALADDEIFSKICPMCGEDMQLNKQLLASTPVMVKCLKCGNETKIW
jgi:RNA polymerase subunit RPABC4/transcription elongation factor Spt4